jgi:hypothetical protein
VLRGEGDGDGDGVGGGVDAGDGAVVPGSTLVTGPGLTGVGDAPDPQAATPSKSPAVITMNAHTRTKNTVISPLAILMLPTQRRFMGPGMRRTRGRVRCHRSSGRKITTSRADGSYVT